MVSSPRCWPRWRPARASCAPPAATSNSFFAWLTAFRPTWYSAVPTMHQAILAQARQQSRASGGLSATLRPLLVGSAAATHLRGTGADFRDPGDRVLRDDGNRFLAHRMQSAAAAPAQGGFGRHTGGVGRRDHGRRRGSAARRPDRAGRRPRRERHAGLRRRPNGDRRPRLQAIGSRQAIRASSMTTGTCFSPAACGR